MGFVAAGYDVPLSTPYEQEQHEQEQHERLALMVDASPSLIVALSPGGAIRFMNGAAERATGFSAAQLAGQLWWTLCDLGDQHEQVEALLRLLEQGDVTSYELPLYARGGQERRIRWAFRRRLDDDGRLQELIGWGTDVTQEGTRRGPAQAGFAQASNAGDAALLMVATYQLNTLLTPLLLGLQLLRRRARRGALSTPDGEALGLLVGQTLKLSRLLNALVRVFQLQADARLSQTRPLDLGMLVSHHLELLTTGLRHQPLVVLLPADPIIVWGEPALLEQLLEGLLDDALRASPGQACIEIRVEDDGSHARLVLNDQGPVVPIEQLDEYAVPFANGSSHLPRLGVGLCMAHHIAAWHGGTVAVRRTEYNEQSVVVTLPRLAALSREQSREV